MKKLILLIVSLVTFVSAAHAQTTVINGKIRVVATSTPASEAHAIRFPSGSLTNSACADHAFIEYDDKGLLAKALTADKTQENVDVFVDYGFLGVGQGYYLRGVNADLRCMVLFITTP